MDPYQDLIDSIARLQAEDGGSYEERVATAALIRAHFHREFVRCRRTLLREGVESTVSDMGAYVGFTVGGCGIKVYRASGQALVRVVVSGVVVVRGVMDRHGDVPALSDEECVDLARQGARAFLAMVRQDMAGPGRA